MLSLNAALLYFIAEKLSLFIKELIKYVIWIFRPLLGPADCRYPLSCTRYAYEQLDSKPLYKALYLIVKRVLSCW